MPAQAQQDLLIALQRGVALVRHPWSAMAMALGIPEAEVLRATQELFERGVARRFGAVFDSRHLGYGSTLCAVDVPLADLERVAALLHPHPGITHCYEREGRPNLWFTMTAQSDRLEDELRKVGAALNPHQILNLPAVRRFKVEVVLDAVEDDTAGGVIGEVLPDAGKQALSPCFTDREKALIRKIQGNLPLTGAPFASVAQELEWDQDDLLRQLAAWKQAGILRRIGCILRHRAAGFVSNGMCVWPVAEADVVRAGRALAANPEVTHCYERPSSPAFPFNLFAMIHAREQGAAEKTFHRLSERAALSGGRMLISTREFKKSSPVFFCETPVATGKPGSA